MADPDTPPLIMVLAIDYPSLAAIEEALVSPVQTRPRAMTSSARLFNRATPFTSESGPLAGQGGGLGRQRDQRAQPDDKASACSLGRQIQGCSAKLPGAMAGPQKLPVLWI